MMPRPPKRQGRVERAQAWSVRGVRRASERESRIRASYHAAESAVREGLMVRIQKPGRAEAHARRRATRTWGLSMMARRTLKREETLLKSLRWGRADAKVSTWPQGPQESRIQAQAAVK